MHDTPSEQPAASGLKGLYKRAVRRALRAGLVDVEDRLDTLADRLDADADRVAVWRGTLADGAAILDDGREIPELTVKYRGELAFWVGTCRDTDPAGAVAGDFEGTFGGWQRDRLAELGSMVGLEDPAAVAQWCAQRVALEIGAGPFPMIAVAEWAAAIACDPLADGYVAEDLLPKRAHADRLVYLAAAGERIPLPAASADVVVIENCLDHVSDPPRVMREIHRLLRPGGLCWLLCDLMDFKDAMHPHAFNETRLRAVISEAGFETVRDRVSDHKSHPEAYGELRALLRKPAIESAPASPVVTVHTKQATHA